MVLLRRQRLAAVTYSVSLVLLPVSSRLLLPWASRMKSWLSLLVLLASEASWVSIRSIMRIHGLTDISGAIIGRRITPTELPQMVAALHSVVGLAAVFTSIGSVMTDLTDISTLHLVTAYMGVLIGGVTFTGSVVAFLKLAGRIKSRPLQLPGRHLINGTMLGTNMAMMGAFITMAPGSPLIAAGALGANTLLSFLKGYTTTAAIGGADMRKSSPWPAVLTLLTRGQLSSSLF